MKRTPALRDFVASVVITGMSVIPVLAADTAQSPTPPVPAIGAVIIWYACWRRKAHEIGGWLLYFYIQLYLGVLFSAVMILTSVENYFPSTWTENPSLYPLFLLAALPMPLLLVVQVGIAEVLRRSREARFLRALRTVLWIDLAAADLALVIDWTQFPDNVPFDVLGFIWPAIWLPYFYRSKRVKRVFETRDWPPMVPATTAAR